MKGFKSWRSYSDFEYAVTRKSRYVWPPEVNEFLQTVLSTSKTRHRIIPAQSILWRAQLGYGLQPYYLEDEHIADEPAPHSKERMKPLREDAAEGRANPKGIPYLYLSNKRETALSEVRPWLGSMISVAQFKVLTKLKVVNFFSKEKRHLIYFKEPSLKEREQAVWIDIDKAFSKPVTLSDRNADYVPTQILAEIFKAEGFDGIAYRSAYSDDYNIVLFDIESADIINCFLYEVTGINFNFEQAANPYFVKKHYDQERKDQR
jgi:hypothetical protein